MTTSATTVTIRETGAPSRSKQAGDCWIRVHGTRASISEKTLDGLAVGDTITAEGKVSLRRATRVSTERDSWDLVVTGDPDDTVELSLGRPQSIDATVTGVRHA